MDVSVSGTSARVAGEVRSWLGRRGISANRAARALGWTHQYMYRRLGGQISFSVDDLDALGQVLDVPASVFFDWPEYEREWNGDEEPEGNRQVNNRRPGVGFRTASNHPDFAAIVPVAA